MSARTDAPVWAASITASFGLHLGLAVALSAVFTAYSTPPAETRITISTMAINEARDVAPEPIVTETETAAVEPAASSPVEAPSAATTDSAALTPQQSPEAEARAAPELAAGAAPAEALAQAETDIAEAEIAA
jgi:hypothetical protein